MKFAIYVWRIFYNGKEISNTTGVADEQGNRALLLST